MLPRYRLIGYGDTRTDKGDKLFPRGEVQAKNIPELIEALVWALWVDRCVTVEVSMEGCVKG